MIGIQEKKALPGKQVPLDASAGLQLSLPARFSGEAHQGKVAVLALCCSQEKYVLQQSDWAEQRCLLGRTSAPAPHPLPMNYAMILHDEFWARWNFFSPSKPFKSPSFLGASSSLGQLHLSFTAEANISLLRLMFHQSQMLALGT